MDKITFLNGLSNEEFAIVEKLQRMDNNHVFTEENYTNAFKVAKAAKKYGLNTDFVLPLVMSESQFNQSALSTAKAVGVMQLMPSTAKSLNVDANNVDENIDGGMRLIKELVGTNNIGNDPVKVLVGYNANTEIRNKFYANENIDELPYETLNYLNNNFKYHGGNTLPSVTNASDNVATTNTKGKKENDKDNLEKSVSPTVENLITGVLGAKAGAAFGAVKVPVAKIFGTAAKNETGFGARNWATTMYTHPVPYEELSRITGMPVRNQEEYARAYASAIIAGKPEVPSQPAQRISVQNRGQTRPIYTYTPEVPAQPAIPPYDLSEYEKKGWRSSPVARYGSTGFGIGASAPTAVHRYFDNPEDKWKTEKAFGTVLGGGALGYIASRVPGLGAVGLATSPSQIESGIKELRSDDISQQQRGLVHTAAGVGAGVAGLGGALTLGGLFFPPLAAVGVPMMGYGSAATIPGLGVDLYDAYRKIFPEKNTETKPVEFVDRVPGTYGHFANTEPSNSELGAVTGMTKNFRRIAPSYP